MPDHFISVPFGGKVHRIRFDNRARYRMASLERPYDLVDLGKPKKSFGALCAWLWACMYEKNPYDTPEDLAEHVTPEIVTELGKAIHDAIMLGLPSETKSEKNDFAGNERLPASNSASVSTNGQS